MICQYNIGINTFFGRIIPPTMNTSFAFFERSFGKLSPSKISDAIYSKFLDYSEKFVENLKEDEFDEDEVERDNKFSNKNEAKQHFYYIMIHLYKKLLASGFTLQELMNPQTPEQYVHSKTYFNNLIEVMEMASPQEKEYNHFAYDYIINQKELEGPIKIIENFNEPSYRISVIDGKHLTEYLKDNRIGLTISGTLFKTHENELSLFYTFLKDLYSLRKKYKNSMYEHPEGSFERSEFNRRQLTTKVIMNSTYGLLGMSTFRYSNKWLAKTITTSGRLALKTAQFYAEKYLEAKFLNN